MITAATCFGPKTIFKWYKVIYSHMLFALIFNQPSQAFLYSHSYLINVTIQFANKTGVLKTECCYLIKHTQQDANHHGNNKFVDHHSNNIQLITSHANSIWRYITVYHMKIALGPKHVVAVTMKRRIVAMTVS
jgi:hypothetical protein